MSGLRPWSIGSFTRTKWQMLDKCLGAWARLELTKPLIGLFLVRPRYTIQEVTLHTHLTSGFNFFSRVKVVLWFKIILFVSCYLTNWILQKLRTEISVLTESAFDRLISFRQYLGETVWKVKHYIRKRTKYKYNYVILTGKRDCHN